MYIIYKYIYIYIYIYIIYAHICEYITENLCIYIYTHTHTQIYRYQILYGVRARVYVSRFNK